MAGKLDESRLESALLRFPREIKRVDRDAVAPETGARVEGHEPERLRLGRVHHFPDVDAQRLAHQRELVDESDVDRPERVLEELHHLGDAWRADRNDRLDRSLIERLGQAGTGRGHAADDFRDVAGVE